MRPTAITLALSAAVVLAVGLGLGALLFGSSGGSSSSTTTTSTATSASASADTQQISLPASLSGLRDAADVAADKGAKSSIVAGRRHNEAVVAAATAAAYSHAFGGAAAAYRAYSDSALLKLPYVIAVRAAAPGLTIGPVVDAKYLGLATAPREVTAVGAVQCQIEWAPITVAGQTPPPSSELVVGCQRSGPRLTVFVGGAGFTGPGGLSAMVGLANAAYAAASSG
jgi:hypothetical protein